MPHKKTYKLSILIATYNRAHIINYCLQSLVEQTALQDDFEVIIINNKCTDTTDEVVQGFAGKIKNLRIIYEEKQGLSHARNAGFAATQSDWLAYLDDDAQARPTWVEVIFREIEHGKFDAFGGPYLAWHHYGPAPKWFAPDWCSTAHLFNYYGEIPIQRACPIGCNCVLRKDAVLKVGGFDAKLGMTGNTCAYGEETKLFEDMRKAGFRLGSVPDLVIAHCVLPYKYSMKWRVKAAFAHGYAAPHVEPHIAKALFFPRRMAGLVKQLLLFPCRIIQGICAKHAWQRVFLESITPTLYSAGTLYSCAKILYAKLTKSQKA